MKLRKVKFTLIAYIATTFFLSGLNAQVTIGDTSEPSKGSLLQLKEDNNSAANSTKGFMLPRVILHKLDELKMGESPSELIIPPADWAVHTGLVVYNTTDEISTNLCKGIYTWNGSIWNRLGKNCPAVFRLEYPANGILSFGTTTALQKAKITTNADNWAHSWKATSFGNVISLSDLPGLNSQLSMSKEFSFTPPSGTAAYVGHGVGGTETQTSIKFKTDQSDIVNKEIELTLKREIPVVYQYSRTSHVSEIPLSGGNLEIYANTNVKWGAKVNNNAETTQEADNNPMSPTYGYGEKKITIPIAANGTWTDKQYEVFARKAGVAWGAKETTLTQKGYTLKMNAPRNYDSDIVWALATDYIGYLQMDINKYTKNPAAFLAQNARAFIPGISGDFVQINFKTDTQAPTFEVSWWLVNTSTNAESLIQKQNITLTDTNDKRFLIPTPAYSTGNRRRVRLYYTQPGKTGAERVLLYEAWQLPEWGNTRNGLTLTNRRLYLTWNECNTLCTSKGWRIPSINDYKTYFGITTSGTFLADNGTMSPYDLAIEYSDLEVGKEITTTESGTTWSMHLQEVYSEVEWRTSVNEYAIHGIGLTRRKRGPAEGNTTGTRYTFEWGKDRNDGRGGQIIGTTHPSIIINQIKQGESPYYKKVCWCIK